MTPKPRKDDALTVDMHVYMTERDHAALRDAAKEQCRPINQQLLYYLRRGLANDHVSMSPLNDPVAERIRNAGRPKARA